MKLYTRSSKPGASLYVTFKLNGRPYQWCTKTADPVKAQERAEEYKQRILDGNMGMVAQMKQRGTFPTIRELIEFYKANAVDTTAASKDQCAWALMRILDAAGIRDNRTVDVLTENVWQSYRRKRTAGLEGPALESAKRTVNADLGKAKAVFCRTMMRLYKSHFTMPSLTGFLDIQWFRAPLSCYRSRPGTQLQEALELAKAKGPAYEAMTLLALFAGLRRSEAWACQWSWFSQSGAGWVITVPGSFKDKEARSVPISNEIYQRLKTISPAGAERVVAPTVELKRFSLRLSACLKKAGIKVQKPLHELRKQFGAEIATRHGLYVAQKLLGHSSPELTSSTYSALISLPGPLVSNEVLAAAYCKTPPAEPPAPQQSASCTSATIGSLNDSHPSGQLSSCGS